MALLAIDADRRCEARLATWLAEAANTPSTPLEEGAPAVILHDSRFVNVSSSGKLRETRRFAVRVLKRAGQKYAVMSVPYLQGTERIRSMRAWIVHPGGGVREFAKKEFIDMSDSGSDLYSENRRVVLVADREAEEGSVFGYEVEKDDRSIFSQSTWRFQQLIPVRSSEVSIDHPEGWGVRANIYNHQPLSACVEGSVRTWRMANVPAFPDEEFSVGPDEAAIWMALDLLPPESVRQRIELRCFNSWSDVSTFLAEFAEPQATASESISAKAAELIRGSEDDWERLRAIARFVQGVSYCSIQTEVGLGGGYKPHRAAEVLHNAYGECKDKTALFRALAKAAGFETYAAAVYSGASNLVENWPSPMQFNHAIALVRVDGGISSPAIVDGGRFGRLLVFDPTSEYTELGDLPRSIQGNRALVVAKKDGFLVTIPALPPEAQRRQIIVVGGISEQGALAATYSEKSVGQSAADARWFYRRISDAGFQSMIDRHLDHLVGSVTTGKVQATDHRDTDRFEIESEFNVPAFARRIQERLLVFKPSIVPSPVLDLSSGPRKTAIRVPSRCIETEVRLTIPDGFRPSDLPSPVSIDTEFGIYRARVRAGDGAICYTQSLTMRGRVLPPSEHETVRRFFADIARAEQTLVVLERF